MEKAPPRNAGEVLARSRAFLEAKRSGASRLDAELLVAHALGLDRLGLFMALDRPVVTAEIDRARDLVVRRAAGEPTAYLLGFREFYGRRFAVSPAVLIPRPETELVVDLARAFAKAWQAAHPDESLRIVDLGAGSGCIGLTLALEIPEARVVALELSPEAAEVVRANAKALEVPKERFGVHVGDGLEWLAARGPVDLVVSNPPYIDPAQPDGLAADVAASEPAQALYAPAGDPDHFARTLWTHRARILTPGGRAFVELGFDQAERVRGFAAGSTFELHADLEGVPRVFEFAT